MRGPEPTRLPGVKAVPSASSLPRSRAPIAHPTTPSSKRRGGHLGRESCFFCPGFPVSSTFAPDVPEQRSRTQHRPWEDAACAPRARSERGADAKRTATAQIPEKNTPLSFLRSPFSCPALPCSAPLLPSSDPGAPRSFACHFARNFVRLPCAAGRGMLMRERGRALRASRLLSHDWLQRGGRMTLCK